MCIGSFAQCISLLHSRTSSEEVRIGPQEKHVETAKQLLGDGRALNRFVARILDDIANLKAMLQAISIGVHFHCAFTLQLLQL